MNQRQVEIEEGERMPVPRAPGCFRFIHIRPRSGDPKHDRFVILYRKDRSTLKKWSWVPGLGQTDFVSESMEP